MTGAGVRELIAARMAGNEGTCEAGLRQLILAACDFLAQVSSGCQKHQRQFEPMVESQAKATIREFLLEGLRNRGVDSPELKATMVSWAITGAALQWSHEKKTTADELADSVLPTVQTALRAGEQRGPG